MTDRELQKVLNAISELPESEKRDEVTQIILRAASESITLKKLKAMLPQSGLTENKQGKTGGYIKFSNKEIDQMPDYMKRIFIVNESAVPYRVIDGLYQARYRRDGFNIEVASKDFKTMKKKFMEKLIEKTTERENKTFPLFKDFVADWMKVKKQTVKPSTYESYSNLIEFNLISRFGYRHLNEITRKDIQDFLFELTDSGKMRTAAKLKQMLKAIFDVAAEDYDIKSPMAKIVLPHYEVKKGKAFTKAEEKIIVDFCRENPQYQGNSAVLVLLYTGMRVGELASLNFDGKYITCKSEKTRKGYADVVRKIPVSPMLRRVLDLIDFDKAKHSPNFTVRDALKRIFPTRHVHELRYSFVTRAKESGCNPELVMKWVGHEYDSDVKTSRVDRGYTDYSEEYALSEINKIDYKL